MHVQGKQCLAQTTYCWSASPKARVSAMHPPVALSLPQLLSSQEQHFGLLGKGKVSKSHYGCYQTQSHNGSGLKQPLATPARPVQMAASAQQSWATPRAGRSGQKRHFRKPEPSQRSSPGPPFWPFGQSGQGRTGGHPVDASRIGWHCKWNIWVVPRVFSDSSC